MDPQPPRLLADSMLGSLARWLRLLGYDTAYDGDATDDALARRARAEGRLLLTRDRELANRRGVHSVLIESQVLHDQVRQVISALPPDRQPHGPRCSVCNETLELAERDAVAKRVPPFVLRTHGAFHRCPGCDRVYWAGTHFNAISEQLESLSGANEEDH